MKQLTSAALTTPVRDPEPKIVASCGPRGRARPSRRQRGRAPHSPRWPLAETVEQAALGVMHHVGGQVLEPQRQRIAGKLTATLAAYCRSRFLPGQLLRPSSSVGSPLGSQNAGGLFRLWAEPDRRIIKSEGPGLAPGPSTEGRCRVSTLTVSLTSCRRARRDRRCRAFSSPRPST